MANLENKDKTPEGGKGVGRKVQQTAKTVAEESRRALEHPVATVSNLAKQAAEDVQKPAWWTRLLLWIFWIFLSLFVAVVIIINLPVTKQWAADQALELLNRDFKAEMSTESVTVNYFGDVTIRGIVIKDYKGYPFFKANVLRANSDWISLAKNAITGKSNSLSFNNITLEKPVIGVITYQGDSISNFVRYVDNFNTGPRKPNKPPFELNSRLVITDGTLSIINQNSPEDKGRWLDSQHLNLIVPKVKVLGGNVSAQINKLSFLTERWGKKHFVDTFSTTLTLDKKALDLKNLFFYTDHSLLRGSLRFDLNKGEWKDFADKVRWNMHLEPGSNISGYDISYFATGWDSFHNFGLSGNMTGPLNNFLLENFALSDGDTNVRTGKMHLTNLLKGNFIIESSDISASLDYAHLRASLPTFVQEKMGKFADPFGRIRYVGQAKVMPTSVYIPQGNLTTSIGSAQVRSFILTDTNTPNPAYRGFANVQSFNVAAITKSNLIGLLNGNFYLNGRGFKPNTLRVETKSHINAVEIQGRQVYNIDLNGLLDARIYHGHIAVDDHMAKVTADGTINFQTSRIQGELDADIAHLNLNYFTGQGGDQTVQGKFNGKFALSTLNDLFVDAKLSNASFTNNGKTYGIEDADVDISYENGTRVLSVLSPNTLNARITGRYQLADLPKMFQSGLGKLLINPPSRQNFQGNYFNFEGEISQNIVNYFLPELKVPRGVFVNGSYDGNRNNIVLNVDSKELSYSGGDAPKIAAVTTIDDDVKQILPAADLSKSGLYAENVAIRINTANEEEPLFLKVEKAEYGSQSFREVAFTGQKSGPQQMRFTAKFETGATAKDGQTDYKPYAFAIFQSTNAAGDYVFNFDTTQIEYNGVTWNIDTQNQPPNQIVYRKNGGGLSIKNLRIYSDDSELLVTEAGFSSGKNFTVQAQINNMSLAKVLQMTSGNANNITGIANGTANIVMKNGVLQPLVDLNVNGITMNGELLGDVVVEAKNSATSNVFDLSARVASSQLLGGNSLVLQGTYDNRVAQGLLNVKADFKDFDLRFANQFVAGVFSNLRGKANGSLSLTGPLSALDYNGDIALSELALKLNYTGVNYRFADNTINISRGRAILNNIQVQDSRNNSAGSVSGALNFESLSALGVELIMRADNLMLLDTSQASNDLFWGRVFGVGDLYVSGPVTSLTIQTPNMKVLPNSVFTFNANSTSNVEEFKMLRFLEVKEDGSVKEGVLKNQSNLLVDFALSVDPGTTVNVLVGDDIGEISVRGQAEKMRFQMQRGAIRMDGLYTVDNGTFTSKAVLNKTFQIEKGSNIEWNGNALTPRLDITANYARTVANAGEYLGLGALPPIDVRLQVKIGQSLNNPKIDLNVQAEDVSSQIRETLNAKLAQEDERLLQFGSVLLLNRFNAVNAGSTVGNLAQNTGYDLLFKQLGAVLNTISNEFQIDLNYVRGDVASNTGDRANAGVNVDLSPRVTLKTAVGIPLSKGSDYANTNFLSGEGTLEYDASKRNDGSLIVRGYSKPMNIGLNGTLNVGNINQAYGMGIVYSKSFETLFGKKKKRIPLIEQQAIKDTATLQNQEKSALK